MTNADGLGSQNPILEGAGKGGLLPELFRQAPAATTGPPPWFRWNGPSARPHPAETRRLHGRIATMRPNQYTVSPQTVVEQIPKSQPLTESTAVLPTIHSHNCPCRICDPLRPTATAPTRADTGPTSPQEFVEHEQETRSHQGATPAITVDVVLDSRISQYSHAKGVKGPVRTIRWIMDSIRAGDMKIADGDLRSKTGEVRAVFLEKPSDGNKEAVKTWESKYRTVKKRLPAFTARGVFGYRNDKGLQQATACLIIDLDHCGQHLDEIKARVQGNPAVLAFFVSPSGDGLKILIVIDDRQGPVTAETHKGAFFACRSYMERILPEGVTVDESGKNLSRLCFMAHDPDAYVASSDKRLIPIVIETGAAQQAPKGRRRASATDKGKADGEKKPARLPVDIIAALKKFKPGDDHNAWLDGLFTLKAAGCSMEQAEEWSRQGAKYQPGEVEERWSGLNPSETTRQARAAIRTWAAAGQYSKENRHQGPGGRPHSEKTLTLKGMREQGWSVGQSNGRTFLERGSQVNAIKAMHHLGIGGSIRLNLWNRTLEKGDPDITLDELVSEYRGLIESKFLDVNYVPSRQSIAEAITHHKLRNAYNPAVDAIRSKRWDETDRLACYGTEVYGLDPLDELGNAIAALIPRGAVVRALAPGAVFPYIPIIRSDEQGPGKDDSLLYIAPGGFIDGLDLWSFDYQKKLQERGRFVSIIGYGELSTLTGKLLDRFKEVATLVSLLNREAYDKDATLRQMHFIIVATTNKKYFLGDSEHRRYPVVEIPVGCQVNLAWLQENAQQIWAQVAAEFDAGAYLEQDGRTGVRLPQHLWRHANEASRQFESEDPLRVWIASHLRERDWISSDKLHSMIASSYGKERAQEGLGEAMNQEGWVSCQRRIGGQKHRHWERKGDNHPRTIAS